MGADDRVNIMAVLIQPIITQIEAVALSVLGTDNINVILAINVENTLQYGANVPRETGADILKGILTRWSYDLEDLNPMEVTTEGTGPFDYLLREFEKTVRGGPGEYENERLELLRYVGRLIEKAKE